MKNYDGVSQENNSEEDGVDSLLERASDEAGRILCSIQALAGTTSCKGVQIAGLKKWAIDNGCWIDNPNTIGVFSDRGSENEVYMDVNHSMVYKLNDFRYADDNLTPFFNRIRIHNSLFPDCAYSFVGLSENREGKICAVISQPFVRADREASTEEIAGALALMGFMPMQGGEYFSNGKIDVFDALPNNVLHGEDGSFYFIDTIICESSDDFLESYKSLSPNYSK
ncbi:MAG: hypothetical protein K2N16_01110 [Muribaculaceae bacterium]|nr:hypothetical protein [Muribaculaceae bacterium]